MADKTKYYYLKIKENFFDSEDMKLLESMDNGYLYSNILMKMYLLSLKNGGKLMYKDKIPYNSKMLSTILNHNVDVLDNAIKVFKELNLIEILDSGAIFMLDIQNYIGKSSDEADRKREYRNRIEETKKIETDKCPDISPTNCSNIKDRDKDIYNISSKSPQKNKIFEERFEIFYKEYPRHLDKEQVKKWFLKNKPNEELFNIIMNRLQEYKKVWENKEKKYIPYPSTWLNKKKWEDEIEEEIINNSNNEVKLKKVGNGAFIIGG